LPDFPGRVKQHSQAISAQLLPHAAERDYSRDEFLWKEALRSLTLRRRVIFPLEHPDFAFDDDSVPHGSRLWTNVISLLASLAWLEQRNRRKIELSSGEVAIEATPEDYAQAYRIFNAACKRTVINLSTAHRKILDGVFSLQESDPGRYGFTQREIANAADVSRSTVSDNKAFLVMSAKLLKEGEDGLALVEGAEPSWWAEGELMKGLPTPEQVQTWWNDRPDPEGGEGPARSESAERAEQPSRVPNQGEKLDRNGHYGARHSTEQPPSARQAEEEVAPSARQVLGKAPSGENGIGQGNGASEDPRARLLGMLGNIQPSGKVSSLFASPPPWLQEALEAYLRDTEKNFSPLCTLVAAEVLGDGDRGEEVEEELCEVLGKRR